MEVEGRAVRNRIYPKLYDATYISRKANLKTFKFLINILKASSSKEELKILDLGCGYKPFERFLLEQGFTNIKYTGIDFNNDSKADIILDLNKDEIPFREETFDLIILSEVLEHLYNPFHAFGEAQRVLKKGGFMYISTPFVFHYHGVPYDYYRYTEFFYRKIAEDYQLNIIKVQKAGTFISVPLYSFNLFVTAISKKLRVKPIGYLLNFIVNSLAIFLDGVVLSIGSKLKINEELQYMNCSISIIMQK